MHCFQEVANFFFSLSSLVLFVCLLLLPFIELLWLKSFANSISYLQLNDRRKEFTFLTTLNTTLSHLYLDICLLD